MLEEKRKQKCKRKVVSPGSWASCLRLREVRWEFEISGAFPIWRQRTAAVYS